MQCKRIVGLALLAAAAAVLGLHAEEPWSPAPSAKEIQAMYQQGVDAVHKNDYAGAAAIFEKALAKDKKNADVLTMLAYSQRKQGKLDEAFANYRKALEINPKHAEAREYLGEAHIQAALKELEILEGYGEAGKKSADDLREALKKAGAPKS